MDTRTTGTDSTVFNEFSQTDFNTFWPRLLAELGKLQASFINGEDILLPLCRILADVSQSQAVLIVPKDCLDFEDMPASSTCWCRDPVRYLTLWKEAKDWPFATQNPIVHRWQSFIVWPAKDVNIQIFFHSSSELWLSFLIDSSDLLSDIIMGMLVQQTVDWQERAKSRVVQSIDSEMFQSIVSNSEDLILVASRSPFGVPSIMYANAAATSISHYPRTQLIGKPITLLFPNQVFKDGMSSGYDESELLQAINTRTEFDGELVCTKADKETALLHMHLVALEERSEHGSLFALVGRDITEQKQLQQLMARTQKMQAMGQLVGGIAHDFNNILGVLKGNLELMSLKSSDEKVERYLGIAFKACQRGTDLTRRLLQFSRQEQFSAQSCDVNDVIEGLEELLGKSLTTQIKLVTEVKSNLGNIYVDRGDLEDALINLVLNAKDSMSGEGQITIRTDKSYLSGLLPGITGRPLVESGEYITISVIDHGSGIQTALLEKIFEPFFTTKDKSKGTGLGLSMVYGFVKRSKGYMSVIKSDSQGTEFRLWFPVAKKLVPLEIQSDERGGIPRVANKLKVLIVDDEEELLTVLTDYCELLGMDVEAYSDPVAVREKYKEGLNGIELLITDVLMPGGINGYELANELSSKEPISVLLISGFIGDIGITNNAEMPYKVLNKPFELGELVTALEQIGISFSPRDI
ncbi:PAS/PAC sensor hybrid histidine kinase [Shewanella sediminis HAW-EB3]|uniref:histidine kinase n=1 Tax=Shewanella sediminis (strain HAW-EB3) TaxID=425104 RepID=A8FSG8_SHESH|nr:ATP-binding protein [Shewanella sediminis]ABV35791.1 PAS/PAC sensor hybrid histidine kinase [Shewanella sediminis HAW-EB3]